MLGVLEVPIVHIVLEVLIVHIELPEQVGHTVVPGFADSADSADSGHIAVVVVAVLTAVVGSGHTAVAVVVVAETAAATGAAVPEIEAAVAVVDTEAVVPGWEDGSWPQYLRLQKELGPPALVVPATSSIEPWELLQSLVHWKLPVLYRPSLLLLIDWNRGFCRHYTRLFLTLSHQTQCLSRWLYRLT